MSDEIVFDVLCTKVLDALRALGLGKFSIRNYYYEGMWPIIKVYRSEGVIFYSAAGQKSERHPFSSRSMFKPEK